MKKIIILTMVLLTLSLSVCAQDAQESNEDKQIISTIDTYYSSFAHEDMDSYLNTLSLPKGSENLKEKHVQEIWDAIDTLEYEINSFDIEKKDSFAAVTYTASFKIYFIKEQKIVEDKKEYTALMIKEDKWRILVVGNAKEMYQALTNLMLSNNETKLEPIQIIPKSTCGDDICEIDETCEKDCKILNYTCQNCQIVGENINLTQKEDNTLRCAFNKDFLNQELSLEKLEEKIPGFAADLITKDSKIKLVIDETIYYLEIKNKILSASESTEDYDYEIFISSCTIAAIQQETLSADQAYDKGLIKIKGGNMISKLKVTLGNIILNLLGLFKKEPAKVIVEAETGVLSDAKRYSFIGPTSRGPGELYLGDGGASATYNVKIPKNGNYLLYVRVSDDGLHPNGARSVTFKIDDAVLEYNHISKNYISLPNYWGYELIGNIDLTKGKHLIIITKPKQTSAAFTMDNFILTEKSMD